MYKINKLSAVKFCYSISLKSIKSLTLIELLVSVIIVGIMIVGISTFAIFSNTQVVDSDRRAKVQNQLAYCLEHMSKYVQQANGDKNPNNQPIKYYPNLGAKTGFQVRYDCQTTQTPKDYTDDVWIYYTLDSATHQLSVGNSGACAEVPNEVLSSKIIGNFNNTLFPLPANPTDGFYVIIDALGNSANIGLVGRYDPAQPVITGTTFVNPQVETRTKIICNSSSTN